MTGSIELLEAGDVDCIFGVERVPAEVTSKQAIVCTVPRSKTAGAVDLRLADASSADNGLDFGTEILTVEVAASQTVQSVATTIGHLVVEVSNNGKDFSSDGITFEAY